MKTLVLILWLAAYCGLCAFIVPRAIAWTNGYPCGHVRYQGHDYWACYP